MKNILVPYDFSECAVYALNQAVFLAQKTGANLHVYHVAPLHPYWKDLSKSDSEAYNQNVKVAYGVEQKLAEVKLRMEGMGVAVTTRFTPGPIIENVVRYTEEFKIDLLVMGTHGMSGIKEWMIGSNAQKILRQVACPVLAIKHDLVYRDFQKIAFVSSFHHENKQPFLVVLDLAGIFKSEILLVNMDEPGFFRDPLLVIRTAMREFQDLARSRGLACSIKRLASGSLEDGMKQLIAEEAIDLVAITTHGKGPLARIFASSLAEAVVNHLQKPVMTIRI
jgi:nucleotide-binding universal stress UspA family protein